MRLGSVNYETRGKIAILTLDEPSKLNALSAGIRTGILEGLKKADADDAIRVAIITGSGDKAFCAGADISGFDFDPEKARGFLIAALQVLAAIVETGKRASEVCRVFEPVPQLLRNVRYDQGKPLEARRVQRAIAAGEARLGTEGRLVICNSGTEPVIRVMAQGEYGALLTSVVDEVCEVILAVALGPQVVESPAGSAIQAAE